MFDNEVLAKYNIYDCLCNPNNKKIILTDCMDTIVRRDTDLNGILHQWSKRLSKTYGIHDKFLYLYRSEVVEGKMHNVVPIYTIYSELYDQCVYFNLMSGVDKEKFCETALKIEIDCEINSQKLITDTESFLRNQKRNGCKIYCVSDFRLSAGAIKSFFDANNVVDLIDEVYSSCDYGKTKKEGTLYDSVLQLIGVDAYDCLMIGDNLKSDCINARKRGIEACLVKNK